MQRYARNTIIKQIGESGQQKLLQARVLVAGAGGLGSTVIASLASIGVGNIGIVDVDTIELSNLNRQYIHKFANIGQNKTDSAQEWVNSYNPDVKVDTHNLRFTDENAGIVADYDVIVDCFDSYQSKFELVKACVDSGKPVVHAGVTEFSGQVMTILPKKSACLFCLFKDPDLQSYILKGIISPTVSFAASVQSSEVVKLLLNLEEKTLSNCIFSFNLLDNDFRKIKIEKNKKCPICS